jgi:phenylalanyl-tRNA synthetase alpha chain
MTGYSRKIVSIGKDLTLQKERSCDSIVTYVKSDDCVSGAYIRYRKYKGSLPCREFFALLLLFKERIINMKDKLKKIMDDAMEQIDATQQLDKLGEIRVSFLGKKGELTSILKSMKDVAPEDRPKVGQMVNEARTVIEEKLEAKKTAFEKALREEKMKAETIDVTLPGKKLPAGHRHPNTLTLEEVENIFIGMGYEVVEGPEIEYDYYNFEALNIPADHPAKDEQDTFYITKDILLRTQTSSVQVHEMEKGKLPIRMIAPGRVFRSDEVDATHSPTFHQIEGLVIDKGITFADLKGTLEEFAKRLFGEETKVKFRPHHFQFTEPSAEMDVTCFKCGGKGCRFCKGEGWVEILGCGMVHPHVLEMSGIDPEEYTGFAFGVGLERIALFKYEIDDMRLLYENDIRFLKQF